MADQTPANGVHALPAGLTPDSIDVPSELAQILARVRYTEKPGHGQSQGPGQQPQSQSQPQPPPPPSQQQQQQQQQPPSNPSPATPAGGTAGASISTKDLPAAIDPLKHKIQRARAAAHTLPDISRSIPEQEAEMRLLEARIERQRATLLQLKQFGLQFAAENGDRDREGEEQEQDVEMGGTGAQQEHGASSSSG